MEIMRLSEVGTETAAEKAATVLRAGGIVLYPTDTLYGLGADALSDEAVTKVQKIKGRDEGKPIHAIVADLAMAKRYAVLNENALALAFWPGPLTLILEKKPDVRTGIGRGLDTFGVRVPNHPFCLALARGFGKPYTGTSANKSGEESKRTVGEIVAQLGNTADSIDLVIDAGELPPSLPSTIVDVHTGTRHILRTGAIKEAEIRNVLRT